MRSLAEILEREFKVRYIINFIVTHTKNSDANDRGGDWKTVTYRCYDYLNHQVTYIHISTLGHIIKSHEKLSKIDKIDNVDENIMHP